MNIRPVTPDDAAALAAIYAPIVLETAISFELEAPDTSEMRARIAKTVPVLPWLVSEDAAGAVSGYVYASKHRERSAYQWSVDVTAYVRDDCRGRGIGKRLYAQLFEELVALGYSHDCTSKGPADAAFHRELSRTAGLARTMFEASLQRVVTNERLEVNRERHP